MESIGLYKTFNKSYGQWQYIAPFRYAFFDQNGECLGRIIWLKSVEGIYLDKCDEEWGIQ